MNKLELVQKLAERSEHGYQIAPLIILDIYEDDSDVPDDMLDIMSWIPKEQDITIFMGHGMSEKFDEMLKYYASNDGHETVKMLTPPFTAEEMFIRTPPKTNKDA